VSLWQRDSGLSYIASLTVEKTDNCVKQLKYGKAARL